MEVTILVIAALAALVSLAIRSILQKKGTNGCKNCLRNEDCEGCGEKRSKK